jgi:hypothetical protein
MRAFFNRFGDRELLLAFMAILGAIVVFVNS